MAIKGYHNINVDQIRAHLTNPITHIPEGHAKEGVKPGSLGHVKIIVMNLQNSLLAKISRILTFIREGEWINNNTSMKKISNNLKALNEHLSQERSKSENLVGEKDLYASAIADMRTVCGFLTTSGVEEDRLNQLAQDIDQLEKDSAAKIINEMIEKARKNAPDEVETNEGWEEETKVADKKEEIAETKQEEKVEAKTEEKEEIVVTSENKEVADIAPKVEEKSAEQVEADLKALIKKAYQFEENGKPVLKNSLGKVFGAYSTDNQALNDIAEAVYSADAEVSRAEMLKADVKAAIELIARGFSQIKMEIPHDLQENMVELQKSVELLK